MLKEAKQSRNTPKVTAAYSERNKTPGLTKPKMKPVTPKLAHPNVGGNVSIPGFSNYASNANHQKMMVKPKPKYTPK